MPAVDQERALTARRSRPSPARKSALAWAFSASNGKPVASATRSIALNRPTTASASIENGFGEAREQPAVRHASIPSGPSGHSAQITKGKATVLAGDAAGRVPELPRRAVRKTDHERSHPRHVQEFRSDPDKTDAAPLRLILGKTPQAQAAGGLWGCLTLSYPF